MKIRSRFLLFLLSSYIAILLVGISYQVSTYRLFSGYLYDSVSETFYSSVGSFTNSIKSLEQLSVTIMANELTQNYLREELLSENSFARTRSREELMLNLSIYTLINPHLKEIILIDSRGNLYNANTNNKSISHYEEFVMGSTLQDTIALQGKYLWSKWESEPTFLILSRKINLIGNYLVQPEAVLFHFVDIEKLLEDNLPQIKSYGLKTSIYYEGDLFYSRLIDDSAYIRQEMENIRYKTVWINGEPHFATRIKTNDKTWEFFFLIPTKELFQDMYRINRIIYLIYLLLFIVFTVLIVRTIQRITSPIIELSKEMKIIDETDFVSTIPLKLPQNASEEVELLYYEFYQMINKIDTLVNKNLKQQLSLNQSQLESLSNQLNPHFLYNTLDSLYWMAELNKQPEMALMVKSLSKLLRSSLNKDDPLITVKGQLDLLNDYFSIQKIRFKERLEYTIDVESELYDKKIPRFTLQPLVENSIKYSLEKKGSQCLIDVIIHRSETAEGMDIRIRDNGPGVSQDKGRSENPGIGLANLQQRLSLLYGSIGKFEINSHAGEGTEIVIFIPYAKEMEE
ncbi:MAG: histidine kinase [Spirochaetales bacterium]|nr:histidine kinase [Spirochaetales bacterium]